ncbi:hypothetical protein GBB97_06140 [Bifidobacterium longum]|nr:hypothetical protein GBC65_06800 [Bifidobacterium longum]KAB7205156.1 hypothetical protein GBB94_07120 [Bifidobacterium longum]KAB7207784.1 hypothetical protein GBC16_06535 [Bifidobacterium longum]KAB7207843.1 hypothetical protein GBB95_06005 [Bifidobacterium longum]KAB7213826.1 hypothetical protein GBB97_06140 [Bifidobacterium longum]
MSRSTAAQLMLIERFPFSYIVFSFFSLFGEYRVLCFALRTAIVRTAIVRTAIVRTAIENIRLWNKE